MTEFLEYEYCETQEDVRKHIQECEGKHTQQAKNKCIDCGKEIDNRSSKCVPCSKKGNDFGKFNKGKIRLDFHKEGNPRWSGGRGITTRGYIEVISNGDHSINTRGRILEHRFVMEKHLGRKLLSTEVVHHINGNKQDNRIENLKLITGGHREHRKEHTPTKETKEKISLALKGRIFSPEHRKNLSLALIGNKNGQIYG